MRGRWFGFGFVPPSGFWFRSVWRLTRGQEWLRMLEEERNEVKAEIDRLKRGDQETKG